MNAARRHSLSTLTIAALTLAGPTNAPAFADDPAGAFKTVTTQDQTASVAIPGSWTLAKGSQGFIFVTGPNDERINLGVLVIGKNAASADSGAAVFALPYDSSLKDKFTTIVQKGAAKGGQPEPQLTFAAELPTKLPMCGRFLGGWTAGDQSRKFEGILCSLAPDHLGLYKNLMFLANVPASLAAQDRPVVEKIAASYRVTPAMFRRMLAPYTPMPPMAAGAGTMPAAMPGMAPYQDPTNSDCFDYNVIRQSPPWEVPMHCGGHKPD